MLQRKFCSGSVDEPVDVVSYKCGTEAPEVCKVASMKLMTVTYDALVS